MILLALAKGMILMRNRGTKMSKTLQNWIDEDKETFQGRQGSIREALVDLKTGMLNSVSDKNKEEVFYMLCFCLLVSQSKQLYVEELIDQLKELNFYKDGIPDDKLRKMLSRKVRFHNRKTDRLLAAREKFKGVFWETLKKKSAEYHAASGKGRTRVLLYVRNWLMKEINGIGLKLSSHFARNIGMRGLAILDVHVLRAMEERGQISDCSALTRDRYYGIEQKVKKYAKLVGISLDELDQLFWSNATGYVGK
ncbi:hypothetical protein LCGC14_1505890 [marine sediment metagenome]|uniref:HhH-GPD domain-containing protein n=1 Tax=marine sediment metagenome TaxID=412755 RepID=A0A0F9JNH4_9ZZZZ